ncbi:MAG: hypothetical protein J6583_13265 [Gilliamella sp.]|uniref:hypothetical protein n=1 Tax=Gilliamella sp. TaxID=1891236 RepID=UPI0025F2A7BD|nr:hypothetical protein [Gilliamella sp.]MCO6544561.1 hypothetical protein [Gilliamella sp.]MCO6548722.1 hypothetical protein [Gilliamella sp.]
MKNSSILNIASSNDIVQLNLDSFAKLEQAELITRFLLNSNHTNKNEFIITVSCIADLLYNVMAQAKL